MKEEFKEYLLTEIQEKVDVEILKKRMLDTRIIKHIPYEPPL